MEQESESTEGLPEGLKGLRAEGLKAGFRD